MRTEKIVVESYTPTWKQNFEVIKKELEAVLEDTAMGIEHVGSTSVEGMSAKPIIDIDVIIKDISMLPNVIARLSHIGYIHEGNLGIAGREAFKYEDKPHLQTHHLYVCPKDSQELHRHLTFRNYLRSHPEAVKKYSQVKIEAAELYPQDIEKYMAYKSACIEEIYGLCGLK